MLKTKKEIHQWLRTHNALEYYDPALKQIVIHDNLIVDINESVYLNNRKISEIPFQFGVIKGNFTCSNNTLTSLKGCPKEVQGDFNCGFNLLTNLEYSPEKVLGDFNCENNQLTSLKGVTQEIGVNFKCGKNNLTNLDFGPHKVGQIYYCHSNPIDNLDNFVCDIGKIFYHSKPNPIKGLEEYYIETNALIIRGSDLSAIIAYNNMDKKIMQKHSSNLPKKKI